MQKTHTLIALLLLAASGSSLADTTNVAVNGQRVSLEANKTPVNTEKIRRRSRHYRPDSARRFPAPLPWRWQR